MSATVHPTAIVEPGARLADDVRIGPSCVVSGEAEVGRGTTLANHVTLVGRVTLGADNAVHPHAVIGGEPQDISYRGSPTRVVIGDRNVIREHVTISLGTEKERGETVIGSGNYLMAGSHVAHDCVIGDHVILANGVLLGGHVRVHSHASLS